MTPRIFKLINSNSNIAIETSKASKLNLDDFVSDINYLKNIGVII